MKKLFSLLSIFLLMLNIGFSQIVKPINNADMYKKVNPSVIKKPVAFAISGPLNKITLSEADIYNLNKVEWIGKEDRTLPDSSEFKKIDYKSIFDPNQQLFTNKSKSTLNLIHNYDGQTAGAFPPDCNGDVGKVYYFQTVNLTYAIYRKSDGSLVANGNLNDIFDSSLPGAGYNDGDPIVIYDSHADRWFYAEFSISGSNDYMLIAVSQTSDPTGNWYSWSFDVDDTPDYMKFGVWQDGYTMATNTSNGNDVYVFDRNAMLNGDPSPTMIGFDNPSRPSTFDGFHCIMPVDNSDGDFAPTGAAPLFITVADDDQSNPADELRIYQINNLDWNNPSNATFSLVQQLAVNSFTGQFDNADWNNVPQPGTSQQLDAVSTVLMFKAQYRNFNGQEKIVAAHSIAETGTEAAIRWYVLGRTGGSGNWSIEQQSTYNPGGTDDHSRWMPGIAMNGAGQIALGFNESSPTDNVFPSIRIVGRSECAPDNTMDIAELNVVDGGTYQSSYERWGDYAGMNVDPSDDYTFWFTTEYINTSNTTKYTKITAVQISSSCNPPSVTNVSPSSLYKDRGKELTITGSDLLGATFTIGGISGTVVSNDGTTAVVDFPAGNYSDGTLIVTNGAGTDNSHSVTILTRNIIPVVSGASATSDNHPTIQSAFDGLYAWYGTTAFDSGDLPGKKTIEVYAGTYNEGAMLTSGLNPTSADSLIIKNHPGDMVDVDATGNNYGFNLSDVNYVTLKGFTVHSADLDNIYAQGNNVTISHNKTYGSVGGSGIKVETGTPFTITNNLSYSNYKYGIEDLSANNTIKNNTADDNGGTYTPATGVTIFDYDVESGDYTGWVVGSGDWGVYNDGTYSNSPTHMFGITNGNDYIQYETVDVTGYDNLTVSCYARSYASNMHNNDDLYGYYSFDGSNWTQFFHIQNDHNSYTQYSATGITPTSTSLYIKFSGICNSNEYWFVDDILVTGDETAPASNTGAGLYVANVSATVENNIFVAKGGNNSYYSLISPGNSATSDYNIYYTTNSAAFDYNGTQDNTGPMGSNDVLSDPLFIDSSDYHIQSDAGSYHGGEWPPLTAVSGTWTNDANVSPALDAGNPADPYQNEPQSGNIINCGAYGNTVQASKSNTVVSLTWDGSTSTDWQDATNWTPEQIPTSSDDITIPNGCPNYPVVDDGISTVAVCNNITIENAASLTIAPNGYMTVSGTITNNAGTAGITIQSDATGTGSLIQNSTSGVNATVKRFLPATSRAWHFVAAPISDATVSVFPTTANLYYYDESTDDFWTGTNYDAGSTMGWTNFTSGNLTPAKGYLFNYFQDTLTFTGNLNTTSAGQNIPIDYTDHGTNAPNGTTYDNYDGWNLIANPFTSAIDWTAVDAHAANLYDAIYVWDGANATYKSYVVGTDSWDSQGTNGATQYIPAMQGFFVKVNESLGTTATLNIPANARVHNTQAFWKADNKNNANLMRVAVSSNDYTDETVIRLRKNATTAMDDHLDAFKLFSYVAAAPQIYTIDENRTEYSINTLPDNGQIFTVPLMIYTYTNDFSISFPEFNFDKYNVYLIDNNNPSIDLNNDVSEGKIFRFKKSGNEEQNRFELLFSPKQEPTEIIANETKTVNIYPNPTSGNLFVRVNNNKGSYLVVIMNELGQIVLEKEFSGNNYQKISIAGKTPGMYFLKIYSNNQVISFKKIILN